MKIVMLRSNPVNPDPRIEKEAVSLKNGGHEVLIVCWNRNKISKSNNTILIDGVLIDVIRGGPECTFGGGISNIVKLIKFQLFLLKWLFENNKKYDAIHAADFDTVIPALLIAKIFSKKIVYDIYDYYVDAFKVPSIIKPIIKFLDKIIINKVDVVIITNESRKEQIAETNPKNLVILHNSPKDFDVPINRKSIPKHNFVYVGMLSEGRLLNEILELFKRRKDWHLQIAGFGLLANEIENISLNHSNIFYHGTVSYQKALELSSSAEILFAIYDPSIPNHKFASPNKLYESMMLGKPVIVCQGSGIDKLVRDENIGLVIKYDINDFEKKCEILLSDNICKLEMGKRARDLYNNKYSWEIMAKRLLDIYKSFMN